MTEIDAMPDPNGPKPMLKVRACESCGGMPHGSVTGELACFKMHLRGARLQMLTPEDLADFTAWRKLQDSIKALPNSTIHLRGK